MAGLEKQTILLAEDNPAAALLVERALGQSKLPYRLQLVTNGLAAVAYLQGEPPYDDRARHPLPVMLITNIHMPRMDGFELLACVRQMPQFERLPVVVISSSEFDAERARIQQFDVLAYLVKPISVEAITSVLLALDSSA